MLKKLNKSQIANFCDQLSMLLGSGVPLLESLSIISRLAKISGLKKVIDELSEGLGLAQAMAGLFPPLVICSISAGEKSGDLEGALRNLASYYHERAEVESKLKSALVYPAFVISLSFLSLIMLFVFVLPGFRSLFSDLEAEIPLFTQILITLGEIIAQNWYWPLMLSLVLGVIIIRFRKTEQGRASRKIEKCRT